MTGVGEVFIFLHSLAVFVDDKFWKRRLLGTGHFLPEENFFVRSRVFLAIIFFQVSLIFLYTYKDY